MFPYKCEYNTCTDICLHTHNSVVFYHDASIYYEVIENPLKYISKYIVVFFNI